MIKRKRGDANIVLSELVFIIFVIAFGVLVFLRVQHVKDSSIVAEELYAKKIALIIDSARPNTNFTFDFSNKIEKEISVYISNKEKYVEVNIGGKEHGYRYDYFNNVNVSWIVVDNKLEMEIK